ncbi:MAG TPA: DUF4340 domain-containing protein [Gemmatimonadales bacterium]|jgi:hypothetical protein|nr:DUF4340 domain-containing protein [Gemmatimonadales bacterium]
MSPQVLKRIALALAVALVIWGALALKGRRRWDQSGGLSLPHLGASAVAEIALRRGRDTVVLHRQGDSWTVNGFPADPNAVKNFFDALADSSTNSELIAQSASSQARLSVDTVNGKRLTITADGKAAFDVWVGTRGPDFEGFYVRPQGSDFVYLLRGRFADLLALGEPEWREKQIASLQPDNIGKVEVMRGKARWSLVRDGHAWRLPGGPADSTKVARFLAQVSTLRATGFPESTELDSISFAHPNRSLILSAADGRTLLSLVFDSTRAGSFWVRGPTGGAIYRLDPRTADLATPAESTLKR